MRTNRLFRFIRRRWRRLVRLMWVMWLPGALCSDLMQWMLLSAGTPQPYAAVVSFTCVHGMFAAAAYYMWVGAAAAATASCVLTSHTYLEQLHVLSVQIDVDLAADSLSIACVRNFAIAAISSLLLLCRVALHVARVVICMPWLASILLLLTLIDVL